LPGGARLPLLAVHFSLLLGAPVSFVPEWTFPLTAEPTLVRTIERGPTQASDIVVVESGHRLRLLAAGSPQAVWEFRSPAPVVDVASPQGGPVALVVATAGALSAFARDHQPLWTVRLADADGDRILGLACGDWNYDRVQEIAAGTTKEILVVSALGRTLARIPHDFGDCSTLLFRDLDGTGDEELVVSAGRHLSAFRFPGEQVFHLRSGAGSEAGVPSAAAQRLAFGMPLAKRPLVVTLARGPDGPGLLGLDAATGLSRWWCYPAAADSVTGEGMVHLAGQNVFAAFRLRRNGWLLARVDSLGRVDRRLRLAPGSGYADLLSTAACGHNLLLAFRTPNGLDALALFTPDLQPVDVQGFGYQGIRIRGLAVGRVNSDADDDLLVARVSPSGRPALDYFRNDIAEVEAELSAVDNEFMTATALGERARALRAARRSLLVARRLGRESRVSSEMIAHLERNSRGRTASRLAVLLALIGSLGGAAVALRIATHRRRPVNRIDRDFDRPGPELQAICSEVIAIDHIFVAKGHHDGALRRLLALRSRYGLGGDPDLADLGSRIEPNYSRFIARLLQHPGAFRISHWLPDQLASLGERYGGVAAATMPREQFERRVRAGGFQGHWLIRIQNWDCPDIYDTLRLFLDRRAPAYFEHWFSDNLRHAAGWSAIVLDYSVNTVWNRKFTVSFWNDGPGRVSLDRTRSNLSQQLLELSRDYAGFLEISRRPEDLQPHEKFWLRFWDFHSILEEIYRRQTGSPAAAPEEASRDARESG
jgi:hypothetical protein